LNHVTTDTPDLENLQRHARTLVRGVRRTFWGKHQEGPEWLNRLANTQAPAPAAGLGALGGNH
jgi:hypothetical protein